MRSFDDADGAPWQAALLHGSYGSILLVFSPLSAGDIRQLPLQSENLAAAEALVRSLDTDGLRRLLGEAEPWAQAGGGI